VNNFIDKLNETGQAVAQKAKDVAEIAKLNALIVSEEASVRARYTELGRLYYQLHGASPEPGVAGLCSAVSDSIKKIADMRAQINLLRGVIKCAVCGLEVDDIYDFCPKCGTKLVHPEPVCTCESDCECEEAPAGDCDCGCDCDCDCEE